MAEQLTHTQFRTTRWSLVLRAFGNPAELNTLLTEYWGPMYAYVRRSGYSRDDADDAVQEFVAQRLVSGSLFEKADPARGRFRTFLKSALRNFLTDQERYDRAQKRSPAAGRTIRSHELNDMEPLSDDDPSSAFDRQWVATLLSKALARVREECETEGQHQHWAAFERTLLLPAGASVAPVPLPQLAGELGADSARTVSAMLQTVRRKFYRLLREVIEETVADPVDAEAELLELRQFLGMSGQ